MGRAPERTPKGTWTEDTWDRPASPPDPPVTHGDMDHRVIGTILGPKGTPLHTVRRLGSVDLGYHGGPR
jgi:hypothetical protein